MQLVAQAQRQALLQASHFGTTYCLGSKIIFHTMSGTTLRRTLSYFLSNF